MGTETTLDNAQNALEIFKSPRMISKMGNALPDHMSHQRMVNVCRSVVQKNSKLLQCTRNSFVRSVIEACEVGLLPTGNLGQGYLVPYYNKKTRQFDAHFQAGYKGLRDLAYRSGMIEWINAEVVFENDHFVHQGGTEPKIIHTPCDGDQGKPIGAFAIAKMKDGGCVGKYLTRSKIIDIRDQYAKHRGEGSIWELHWEAMWCKTVFRKLFVWLPCSVELEKVLAIENRAEHGLDYSTIDVDAETIDENIAIAKALPNQAEKLKNIVLQNKLKED